MQIQITRLPERVEVTVVGQAALRPIFDMVKSLGAQTRSHGDTHLLIDILGLEGELHVAAQMRVGQYISHYFSHLTKVASVVPREKITRTSEKVARANGVQLKVCAARDEAIGWLTATGEAQQDPAVPQNALMDPVRAAVWDALSHLFPKGTQAVQLGSGTLAISWALPDHPGAINEMATPITVRLEPELVDRLQRAEAGERWRIAALLEPDFRAGLLGYEPLTSVPKARVIVLG